MKHYVALLLALLLTLSLTACDDNKESIEVNSDSSSASSPSDLFETFDETEDEADADTTDEADDDTTDEADDDTTDDTTTDSDTGSDILSYYDSLEPSIDTDTDFIDLTTLGSTMLYAELYYMAIKTEEYVGKTIQLEGTFQFYEYVETNQVYYVCLVTDDTGCCSQGLEFLLADESLVYPDDYPETGTTITLTGVFETYEEDGYTYRRLADAVIEW